MLTVLSGGNFFHYDTMHLSEFVLAVKLSRDQTASVHTGIVFKVSRMARVLPANMLSCSMSETPAGLACMLTIWLLPCTAYPWWCIIGM